jgi:rRNA-processing protein FCF1
MASHWVWRDTILKRVILDTNAVLMMFEFSLDIESELSRLLGSYEIIIPTSVQDELMMLAKKGYGRRAQYARAGLQLIKKYTLYDDDTQPVDDSILKIALTIEAFVLTNDKTLHNRLKQKQVNVIYLRGKQTLHLDTS